jgi:hypothetical protein
LTRVDPVVFSLFEHAYFKVGESFAKVGEVSKELTK